MKPVLLAAVAAGLAVTAAPAAVAQVDSVRLGVMAHNVCVIDCKNADKESGVNIAGELRFKSPDFLGWAGSPHPYLMASVNTEGNTSYAGGGLSWDFEFAPGWSLEPGLGYVVHDGENNNPFANGTPEAAAFFEEHVLLGSTDLFRTSLAVTWELSPRFAVQAIYEHLSHGQILGEGRNQGMDEIGVRAVWNFQ
jgi:lipid A 3-O-deacylase